MLPHSVTSKFDKQMCWSDVFPFTSYSVLSRYERTSDNYVFDAEPIEFPVCILIDKLK